AGIPFRVPERADLPDRLDAVLSAIYAAFTAGWARVDVADDRRRGLAGEAIWLGRLMISLMPEEPETLGLLALMLYADARSAARRDTGGSYVPLSDQQMELWDTALIEEAETLLRKASSFGATGRYQLEAAVQSAHCARRRTGRTDWTAIKKLYDVLTMLSPSPVVAINRAVAIAETEGPIAGLEALDAIATDKRLETYQPYWAALADLLARLDRAEEAIAAYDRAIWLEADAAVRTFLKKRQGRIAPPVH
ncbi:MAG: RNA polymerase sigma factor, partial [Rhizobiaceae bacterium]